MAMEVLRTNANQKSARRYQGRRKAAREAPLPPPPFCLRLLLFFAVFLIPVISKCPELTRRFRIAGSDCHILAVVVPSTVEAHLGQRVLQQPFLAKRPKLRVD